MPLPQHIQSERDEIARIGETLATQKDKHLSDFTPIPIALIIKLLRLVRKIAQHDIDHRANYDAERDQKRRSNLGNLALTLKLFHDSARLMNYDVASFYQAPGALQGQLNTNLFDDMRYLTTYNLAATTNPLVELRTISDDNVANILNAVCPILVEIASREIQAIQLRQTNPNFFQQGLPANVLATRNTYNDHRNAAELYYFIMYEKETRKLARALQAIQDAQAIAVAHASPLENKRAFLKCLVVIGEAFTQPNLTPQSRSLSNLAQRDLQLFKNLRNKIADSQYDLYPEHVEAYIAANSLDNIQAELAVLTPQLTLIRTQLQTMQQQNQLAIHYTNNALAAPPQALERFANTRAFLTTLPQTAGTYRHDKISHPNAFVPSNLAQKAQDEIDAIMALTNGIPGESSLTDPKNQDQQLMFGGVDVFLTRLAQVANNDLELAQAIATINTLSQQVHSGRLVVELPGTIVHQHPLNSISVAFIQQHLVLLSSSIKQYARRLEFVNYLNTHTICKNAIEYHFGRMVRFLMEIPNNVIEVEIGAENLAQWRLIRNSIQHDLEELDTYGITANQWLCHYLGIVTQELPNMLQPLIAAAHVAIP